MQPNIGDTVLYHKESESVPAIVTQIHDSKKCSLKVFDSPGGCGVFDVTAAQGTEAGCWDWRQTATAVELQKAQMPHAEWEHSTSDEYVHTEECEDDDRDDSGVADSVRGDN
jgi:hypothetical protein